MANIEQAMNQMIHMLLALYLENRPLTLLPLYNLVLVFAFSKRIDTIMTNQDANSFRLPDEIVAQEPLWSHLLENHGLSRCDAVETHTYHEPSPVDSTACCWKTSASYALFTFRLLDIDRIELIAFRIDLFEDWSS